MTHLSIDDRRSFSDRGDPLPLALAEPVERGAEEATTLEHNAHYVLRFADSDDSGAGAGYIEMLHFAGYWIGAGDSGYVEGPLTVAEANYEVFAKSPRVSPHAA